MKRVISALVVGVLLLAAFIKITRHDFWPQEKLQDTAPRIGFYKTVDPHLLNLGVEYVAEFRNYPTDAEYRLAMSRVASEEVNKYAILSKLRFNSDGTYSSNGIQQPIAIPKVGILPGERIRYKLLTSDDVVAGTYSFVPYPITAGSKEGRFVIQAELVSLFPTIYEISFQGLKPHELVKIRSVNAGSVSEHYFDPDMHNGVFHYLPLAISQQGGQAKLTISSKDKDNAALYLTWGTNLIDDYLNRLKALQKFNPDNN